MFIECCMYIRSWSGLIRDNFEEKIEKYFLLNVK